MANYRDALTDACGGMHTMARVMALLGLMFLISGVAEAAKGAVANENVGFVVAYDDGTAERMVAKYTSVVEQEVQRKGRSSKPFEGKPIDTRRCNWSTSGFIRRDVCVVSRALGEQCKGDLTELFFVGETGRTKKQDVLQGRLKVKTCGDAHKNIRGDFNKVRSQVKDALDGVIEKDLETVKQRIAQHANVSEVTFD